MGFNNLKESKGASSHVCVIFPVCTVLSLCYVKCIIRRRYVSSYAGCLHPEHNGYFSSPAEYMKWYKRHGPLGSDPTYPTVAVLLYRKHVITEQMYIGQLISKMEEQGVRPIPIFINGIEAHTVVSHLSSVMCDALVLRHCSAYRDWCHWHLELGYDTLSKYLAWAGTPESYYYCTLHLAHGRT